MQTTKRVPADRPDELNRGSQQQIDDSARGVDVLDKIVDEIGDLARLDDDWNDEGAPKIHSDTIVRAQRFVRGLKRLFDSRAIGELSEPIVFPSIDGGVSLVWSMTGSRKSISFHPDRSEIDVRVKRTGSSVEH